MKTLERPYLNRTREQHRDRLRRANRDQAQRLLDLVREGERLGLPVRRQNEIRVPIRRVQPAEHSAAKEQEESHDQ